ncbi:MAG: 16S rRNA (guanine(966)-N(2))-methyltransferase RsmD [Clostridia bacterium]|nr:16S rRNA (guanine(966)-N(2))-methyltransferase RsmD [Clostridia bacterium]
MRIIGGKAKGTKLYTLEGENTRPTLDRVRESLFNILQYELSDSIFLDLFSGSGACGIEAVSRGVKKAILCDKSKRAIEIIKKNVAKTHIEEKVEIYQLGFEELLKTKIKEKPDIVFIDPPYQTDYAYQAIKIMLENNLIKEETILIIETNQEKRIKEEIEELEIEIMDERKYGRVHLMFLRQKRKG